MPDEKNLLGSLLAAYGIIRQQTEQICDLYILLVPLVDALDPKLRKAYLHCQSLRQRELVELKRDSVALVDEAIRRLKET